MTREDFLNELKSCQYEPEECKTCPERADCEAAGLQTVSFFELTGGIVQVVNDEDGDSVVVFDMDWFKFNFDGIPEDTEDEICVIYSFPLGQIQVVDLDASGLRQAVRNLIVSKAGKEIDWFEEPARLEL